MQRWVRRLVDPTDPRSVASAFRRRRRVHLDEVLAGVPAPVRILDVGGTEAYWRTLYPDCEERPWHITLLNVGEPPAVSPPFAAVRGDARDLGRFPDGSFDVVHANSVLEHVGGLHDQRRMAAEVRRVGRHHVVQTPNRNFPLEPHFLVPLFQFLPVEVQVRLVQRFALGWYPRIPDREAARAHVRAHRLLTEAELRALFPDSTIHRERVAGLTKSLLAVR